jgi:hypothetical protein
MLKQASAEYTRVKNAVWFYVQVFPAVAKREKLEHQIKFKN